MPDIQLSNLLRTDVSPLSAVVNEARSEVKRISTTYLAPFTSSNDSKPPHLLEITEFELVKSRFYSDIAQRLKDFSCNCMTMQQSQNTANASTRVNFDQNDRLTHKTAFSPHLCDSFDSIPFIDDETSSLMSFYEIRAPKPVDFEIDVSLRIEELIKNLTNENFDRLLTSLLTKCPYGELVWCKIVYIFEFVNMSVQMVLNKFSIRKEEKISKLKEMGASYIHVKYCDWIYQQGGWISTVS